MSLHLRADQGVTLHCIRMSMCSPYYSSRHNLADQCSKVCSTVCSKVYSKVYSKDESIYIIYIYDALLSPTHISSCRGCVSQRGFALRSSCP